MDEYAYDSRQVYHKSSGKRRVMMYTVSLSASIGVYVVEHNGQ